MEGCGGVGRDMLGQVCRKRCALLCYFTMTHTHIYIIYIYICILYIAPIPYSHFYIQRLYNKIFNSASTSFHGKVFISVGPCWGLLLESLSRTPSSVPPTSSVPSGPANPSTPGFRGRPAGSGPATLGVGHWAKQTTIRGRARRVIKCRDSYPRHSIGLPYMPIS